MNINTKTKAKKALPLFGALFLICASFLLSACADPGKGVPLGELFSSEVFVGSTTAGFADGQGTAAEFDAPVGIAVAPDGNIYVADTFNNRIRKITPSGTVTTFAGSGDKGNLDGQGTMAQFDSPSGIAVAPDGNIYIADYGNNRIRKITSSGIVTTFAGSTQGYADGQGTDSKFYHPYGIDVAPDGTIYVTDRENHRIRKITPEGLVSTFAGSTTGYTDAQGTTAQFHYPYGAAAGPDGNIYIADNDNNCIRKITPEGLVSTFAGSTTGGSADGQGAAAQFYYPTGVALDPYGNVFVTDSSEALVRRISPTGKVSTILRGLFVPDDIALTPDASTAYVTDGNRILRLRFR